MPRLGNTDGGSGWIFYGQNVQNAAWSNYTLPNPGGYVTDIGGYFDTGVNGNANCYLCIWNGSNGALIASYPVNNIPNGSHSSGGQQWNSYTLPTPLWVAGNTPLAIGFWAPQHNGLVFTTGLVGTSYSGTQSGSGPGTASGPSTGQPELAAYIDYNTLAAPSVTSVSPNNNPRGTTISLGGSSFLQTTGVTVGGVGASFTINSDTSLTVTIPNTAPFGSQSVTVTNAAGSGSGTVYVIAPPNISGISPPVAAPGSNVTISGSGFSYTSSVTIGGVGASFTVNSDTSITATVPNGVGGGVTVTVTNPAGSSSSSMTAGQIYAGVGGGVQSLVAVWFGDQSGNGVPHKVLGVWCNNGSGGVKRIW